jgi:hypothetical protein
MTLAAPAIAAVQAESSADEEDDERDDETMDDSNEEARLKAAYSEGIAALRGYVADVAQEQEHAGKAQASRESAIANAIRYGAALSVGRAIHATDDNVFHDWVKHTGLDRTPPFDDRRERSAAMQMATILGDGSSTVTAFEGCPHNRPTNIMRWWRAKQPKPAPEPHVPAAEAVREAAPTPAPPTAPKAASAATDRVQVAADKAEIATLRKELIDARAEIERLQRRLEIGEDVNRQKFIFDAFFNQTEPNNPDVDAVVCAQDARVFGHLMRPPRLAMSAPKSLHPSSAAPPPRRRSAPDHRPGRGPPR